MTIAIGLMCRDGIVLCADTQETYGNFKWSVEKLVIDVTHGFPLLIAGAGFGPAIDAATERIIDELAGGVDQKAAVSSIRDILREIIERDLGIYPTERRDDLNFKLLIAAKFTDRRPTLLATDGSLLKTVPHFSIIGSGEIETLAAQTLYRTNLINSEPDLDIEEGKTLAAYITYLGKTQTNVIGGRSKIATLTWSGEIRQAQLWEIPRIEDFFSWYRRRSGELMLACADPEWSFASFNTFLNTFTDEIRQQKQDLNSEIKGWDKFFKPVTDALNSNPLGDKQ
jgi:20S proteasome alpha/beta subunit